MTSIELLNKAQRHLSEAMLNIGFREAAGLRIDEFRYYIDKAQEQLANEVVSNIKQPDILNDIIESFK